MLYLSDRVQVLISQHGLHPTNTRKLVLPGTRLDGTSLTVAAGPFRKNDGLRFSYYVVLCGCGSLTIKSTTNLNKLKTCGCGNKPKHEYAVGYRIPGSRLVVVDGPVVRNRSRYYHFQCDCGVRKWICVANIDKIKSCGCYARERPPHNKLRVGSRKHPLYTTYMLMMRRCHNPKCGEYQYYGAKGVTVCKRWRGDPAAFIEWGLTNGWKPGLTIDRKKAKLEYSPRNCQFLSKVENSKKISTAKIIKYDGSIDSMSGHCRRCRQNPKLVSARILKGWSFKRAIETPVQRSDKPARPRRLLYDVWKMMRRRCECSHDRSYHNYGGRGISVCPEWSTFQTFYDWARPKWAPGLELDRKRTNGDYCPSNCKFSTRRQNVNNRRLTNLVTMGGVTKSVPDWCRELDLYYLTVRRRMTLGGKSAEQALSASTPRHNDGSPRS